MQKYNILLIDDDIFSNPNRHGVFDAFLNNSWADFIQSFFSSVRGLTLTESQLNEMLASFNEVPSPFVVDYFNNVQDRSLAKAISEKHYDAIFLDVMFENAPVQTDFKDVLYAIKKYFDIVPPIFVYTGKLIPGIVNVINDGFYAVFGDKTPNRYYTFSTFADICKAAVMDNCSGLIESREIIRKIISRTKGHVSFSPYEPDAISILHISDLQFGDKHTSNSLNGLANTVSSNVNKVDLLVITGDIAAHGFKEEFDSALIFLNQLRDRLWPAASIQEKMERTIIIPGNHDFDLRTTLLSHFSALLQKETRQIDFESIASQIKDAKKTNTIINQYGLQNFREFAYTLTQRREYLDFSLDFADLRFLNWGLCFYCLNSVGSISSTETNKVYLQEKSDTMKTPANTMAIALCHHTFLCEAPDEIPPADIEKFRKTLYGYVTGNKCKIIIGGHRHKDGSKNGSLNNNDEYHICEAASLRVEGNDHDYIRGYNKYVLHKGDNKFSSITEYHFHISESDSSSDYIEKLYRLPSY